MGTISISGIKLRVKFGFNPYSMPFRCAKCGKEWDNYYHIHKGLFLRIEVNGKIIDFPICPKCSEEKNLLETRTIDTTQDNPSHPIFLA